MSWRGTNYSKKNFPNSGSPFFYVYSDRSSNQVFEKNMHVFIESSYYWDSSLRLISFDLKAELHIILEIEPIQMQRFVHDNQYKS